MIVEERIVRLHTLLRMALENDLTIQDAAARVKQLYHPDWGLSDGDLNAVIDGRIRALQIERAQLDARAQILKQIRDRVLER